MRNWQETEYYSVFSVYRFHGDAPFVANTEEELHDLIKKADIDYSKQHWDAVTSSGNLVAVPISFMLPFLPICYYLLTPVSLIKL